jgi:hypothetical protein
MSTNSKESTELEGMPPLPDEPLPISDEHPPLPDEPAPLPDEESPPLPNEELPEESTPPPETLSAPYNSSANISHASPPQATDVTEPDAWQAIWEPSANAYYFYNTETQESTWLNPRLPPAEAAAYLAANPSNSGPSTQSYAPEPVPESVYDPETGNYAFTARFNARTGKFQNNPEHTSENFSTQGQIMRESREYFDVSVMGQGHVVGKSGGALRADRRHEKIPKKQQKELIRIAKERKDRKKREWYANDDIIVRKH